MGLKDGKIPTTSQVFGGNEPNTGGQTEIWTNKGSGNQIGKGWQSAMGITSSRHAENTRQRQIEQQQNEIKEAMKNRPDVESIRGEDGKLKDGFALGYQKSNQKGLDKRMGQARRAGKTSEFQQARKAVDAMRKEGNQVGLSKWSQARSALAGDQQNQAMNLAGQDASRGVASGMARMAEMGGASGGSRERMLQGANRSAMMANQGINALGNQAQLGISADDAGQKMQIRQGLAGQYGGLDASEQSRIGREQDLAMRKADMWGGMAQGEADRRTGADQFNIGNRMSDVDRVGRDKLAAYSEGMAALGANATANAQYVKPEKWNPMDPFGAMN